MKSNACGVLLRLGLRPRRRIVLLWLAVTPFLLFALMHRIAHPALTHAVGSTLVPWADWRIRCPAIRPLVNPLQSSDHSSPPSYEKLYQWERDLPQHNLSLPYPEGRHGRYVKFTNQIKTLGWNNVLNEVLMNAHLAYESKRAYVFQDYLWKRDYYYWPESQFRQNPPHTPLNALISGPTAGGPWEEGDDTPRSINEAWFDVVCPESERRVISTREVKPALVDSRGDVVLAHWVKLLLDTPERCVEITPAEEDRYPQTFDLWLWGSARVLPLWESFSKSPTSRLLGTSLLVQSAIDRNEHLFMPNSILVHDPTSCSPYERMMAMHIRRGDYKEACISLATWNSTYYSWNLLPFLPDKFIPPPPPWLDTGHSTENTENHSDHCLPNITIIVQKARDSRDDYIRATMDRYKKTLDVMYLLTNERGEWFDSLKDALKQDGWHTIVTSHDLELDSEQTDVNMAIDMDIARKASVFIGNGWSSFTSNIVYRRLVDGKIPLSVRFW